MNSIHLQNFPQINAKIDSALIDEIAKIRHICSTALSIRKEANLRVRLPLAKMWIYGKNVDFIGKYRDIILDEINVKSIELSSDISSIGKEVLQINFKTLGPKIGKDIQKVLNAQKNGEYEKMPSGNVKIADIEIEKCDFDLSFLPNDKIATQFSKGADVAVKLDVELTQDLISEGIMRDINRLIQQDRKANGYNVTDRISIQIATHCDEIVNALNLHKTTLMEQCLADSFEIVPLENLKSYREHEIIDKTIHISLSRL
ncbi:DUF5915 domain-containing protein [Candidatus Deianiraea vastatrix]|uniref:IleS-related oxidoreductase nitrogenase super family protein n=1 Tax=Candidatus Deianiraea vastatrix TaxID=2163644 RepID=A0A5B8XD74_9RICK|nr:DUF5915 domain-containing protein [Candidatus Deianiraea vastatrix]QED23278.1 Putative IleS-related oxidoreductase nitrogenase super family protein [Candidatus Deianiraea vastatrix]